MSDPHTARTRRAEELLRRASENRRMTAHRSFLGYLRSTVTSAPLYAQGQRLLAYLRRLRTVTLLVRLLTLLWSLLQTGALVLLGTALLLVLLPAAAALLGGVLLAAYLESRRSNRFLRERLSNTRVTVLFLPPEEAPGALATARAIAERGSTVLAVSPYLLSSRSPFRKGGFYCTLRREEAGVFLIRKYYFFSLRKHVLSHAEVTLLY